MEKVAFKQARALILNNIHVLGDERKDLLGALGQVGAEAITAKIDVPNWDASALDGFAVGSEDIQGAGSNNPVILEVSGRIIAGQAGVVSAARGKAIRIMTGAPMPKGADCVVGFEDSDEKSRKKRNQGQIGILKAVPAGGNIRRAGEQIKRGSVILQPGQTIGPGEIGLLSSAGLTEINVIRRPVVAILATGEELEQPGRLLAEAKIYCGNSTALAAQVKRCGGLPRILNIARDNLPSIRKQMRRGLQCDMLVTTGGSAGGDRDLVKEITAEMGTIIFDQVEMIPGKSSAFGLLCKETGNGQAEIPHWVLSGNPVAAMLSFEALVRPAVLKMRGMDFSLKTITAEAAETFSNAGSKTRLVWVSRQSQNGIIKVRPADVGVGGVLHSIAASDGIAIIPPGVNKVTAGERIEVSPLDWFSETPWLMG